MDSFSIACTTCQTQLRVRDRSAIGQILTCPKCGSMVLVEPPADAADVTPSSTRTGPPPLPKTPAASRGTADPQAEPANLADTVEDPSLYGLVAAPREDILPDDAVSTSAAELDSGPVSEPILPTDAWVSPSSAAWRYWLLSGCAAVAGIGLAIAVFGWLSRDSAPAPQSPQAYAQPDGSAGSPSVPTTEETPPAAPEDIASGTEDVPPAPPEPALSPEAPPPEAPAITPPTVEDAVRAEPAKPPVDKLEAAIIDSAGEEAVTPPGFVPSADSESMASAAALRETLKAFGAILEEPDVPGEEHSPLEIPASPPTEVAAGTGPERPRPLDIDVESRLADRIPQIDFNDVPLIGFLEFVAEFSTIPVSLDPDVLPYLRISPNTPLTIRQNDTTVDGLLAESLKKVGLGYAIQDDQLWVSRVEERAPRVRQVPFELTDLAAGDAAQLETIRRLTRELIAPDSWKEAGGQGTIQLQEQSLLVQHEETILYQVLGFCEKLRVARGLQPRGKLDPALFALTPRSQRAASLLETPVSVNFLRPERLGVIVSRIGKESGAHILMDWRGAAQMGWNPDAQLSFTSGGRPLAETLRALLEPMELTYRIVDRDLLQITSPMALDAAVELEFYPVAELLGAARTADQLLDAISAHLGAGLLRDQGGLGVLRFDPPSQCVLAALPQPQQQAVAAFLAGLKTGGEEKP